MDKKYNGFADLPVSLVKKFSKLIDDGDLGRETTPFPKYTQKQLEKIVAAFILVNNAVKTGLPNELYDMFARDLDMGLSQYAYKLYATWLAHDGQEGIVEEKERVQAFADSIKAEIDKRAHWPEEIFHREYFVGFHYGIRKYPDK